MNSTKKIIEPKESFRENGNTKAKAVPFSNDKNRKKPVKKKKQDTQKYKWCFTFNNYTNQEFLYVKRWAIKNCNKYIIGKEVGADGTPHLQGQFNLKKKRRLTAMKKISPKIHWEPTRNEETSFTYCMKEGQYFTNIKDDTVTTVEPIFNEFQKDIIKLVDSKADGTTVNWYWEETGGFGKSFISKYVIENYNAIVVSGKESDIFHQIAKREEEDLRTDVVIIDIPLCSTGHISYKALEGILNGLIYSGKYEGFQCTFEPPHVIVFSNEEPDKSKFTKRRWGNVVNLRKKYKL